MITLLEIHRASVGVLNMVCALFLLAMLWHLVRGELDKASEALRTSTTIGVASILLVLTQSHLNADESAGLGIYALMYMCVGAIFGWARAGIWGAQKRAADERQASGWQPAALWWRRNCFEAIDAAFALGTSARKLDLELRRLKTKAHRKDIRRKARRGWFENEDEDEAAPEMSTTSARLFALFMWMREKPCDNLPSPWIDLGGGEKRHSRWREDIARVRELRLAHGINPIWR